MFRNANLAGLLLSRTRVPLRGVITTHHHILTDLRYQGSQNDYPEIIFPHKKPRGGILTNEQKNFNGRLSSDRIIVENYFGRMKLLFGCIHVKFRSNLNLLDDLIPLLIAFTNYNIKKHPLRNDNNLNNNSNNTDTENSNYDSEISDVNISQTFNLNSSQESNSD